MRVRRLLAVAVAAASLLARPVPALLRLLPRGELCDKIRQRVRGAEGRAAPRELGGAGEVRRVRLPQLGDEPVEDRPRVVRLLGQLGLLRLGELAAPLLELAVPLVLLDLVRCLAPPARAPQQPALLERREVLLEPVPRPARSNLRRLERARRCKRRKRRAPLRLGERLAARVGEDALARPDVRPRLVPGQAEPREQLAERRLALFEQRLASRGELLLHLVPRLVALLPLEGAPARVVAVQRARGGEGGARPELVAGAQHLGEGAPRLAPRLLALAPQPLAQLRIGGAHLVLPLAEERPPLRHALDCAVAAVDDELRQHRLPLERRDLAVVRLDGGAQLLGQQRGEGGGGVVDLRERERGLLLRLRSQLRHTRGAGEGRRRRALVRLLLPLPPPRPLGRPSRLRLRLQPPLLRVDRRRLRRGDHRRVRLLALALHLGEPRLLLRGHRLRLPLPRPLVRLAPLAQLACPLRELRLEARRAEDHRAAQLVVLVGEPRLRQQLAHHRLSLRRRAAPGEALLLEGE
mmetsp:Transcript_29660/g.90224  ORF Transcript_29660/g.90224 Transcript_29660/m.90224 type:complete len:522 (+) Transcript_29660:622-2187(+)